MPTPWLVYEVDPGGSLRDGARIANDSNEARSLDLFAADAETRPSGAFIAAARESRPTQAGSWIKLDSAHVDLAPHSAGLVTFTLTVPPGTEPGEHCGSILAQYATPGPQVTIVHRIGLRVYLTVKGKLVESGRIDSVSAGHWWERGWPADDVPIAVGFSATGNVHLKASGSVTSGSSREEFTRSGTYVLVPPRNAVTFRATLAGGFGPRHANVQVLYSNHADHRTSVGVDYWLIPWKLMLLVLAVVTIAIYGGWSGYRAAMSRRVAVSLGGTTMRMSIVDPSDHPEDLAAAPAGSETVIAAVRVTNRGQAPFVFEAARFRLLDTANRVFEHDPGRSRALLDGDDPARQQVEPGGHETVALAFLVPSGSRPRVGTYAGRNGRLVAEMVAWRS